MAAEHRIRLAGPWQLLQGELMITIKLPCSRSEVAAAVDWSQPFELHRRFNTPTNLTAADRVYVEVPECWGEVESVLLDEVSVERVAAHPRRFDISAGLSAFHVVQINLTRCDNEELLAASLVIAEAGSVQ